MKVQKAVKNLNLLLLTLMCQLGIFLQLRSNYNPVMLSEGWPSAGLSPPAMTLARDSIYTWNGNPSQSSLHVTVTRGAGIRVWHWWTKSDSPTHGDLAPWHQSYRSCLLWQPPILPTLQGSRTAFRTVFGHYSFLFLLCMRGAPHHSMDTHCGRSPVPTGSSSRRQWTTIPISQVFGTLYSKVALT